MVVAHRAAGRVAIHAIKKDFWFVRKRYGWGWTPASKEGWTVIALYVALLILWADLFMPDRWADYLVLVVLQTILLLVISYRKGEPPRWQWGDENQKK